MARGVFSASDYIRGTNPPTSYPISVSAWVYIPDLSANSTHHVWAIREEPGNYLGGLVGTTGLTYTQATAIPANSAAVTASGLVTNNTWAHIGGIIESASSRSVFVNGGNKNTNTPTVNVNMAGLDAILFGTFAVGSTPLTTGYLAEMGVWNVVLTDAEMATLGKGFSCHLVRPASLIQHMPGVRSNAATKGDIAVVGSPGVFSHPPIIGAIAA